MNSSLRRQFAPQYRSFRIIIVRTFMMLFPAAGALHAQVPRLINYQGRIAAGGVNFEGSAQFKFAIADAAGTTSYWSNDGTSIAGSEPAAAVMLTVTGGQYLVLPGDASLPNMTAIPESGFINPDLFLRVWFNDGTNGPQHVTPDQRLQVDCVVPAMEAWRQRDSKVPAPAGRYFHRPGPCKWCLRTVLPRPDRPTPMRDMRKWNRTRAEKKLRHQTMKTDPCIPMRCLVRPLRAVLCQRMLCKRRRSCPGGSSLSPNGIPPTSHPRTQELP